MSILGLNFDNRFTDAGLPCDSGDPAEPRHVLDACYTMVNPTEAPEAELIEFNRDVAKLLGISEKDLTSDDFLAVMAGNKITDDMAPYAMNYGGFQFGKWAGQLGDGRAITLGEVVAADGKHLSLQLKGAGPTPFSRTGDGRLVFRAAIREFLASEAMFNLGIATTRTLSLVTTGEAAIRDRFYEGKLFPEPSALISRISPCFMRLGTFELFAVREEEPVLEALVNYTIKTYFAHLSEEVDSKQTPAAVAAWFRAVMDANIDLLVDWMRVGFVHGVLNTDNISIIGETLDYGPFGFVEEFDPTWTPNRTDDEQRRYSLANQPGALHWNLSKFAGALAQIMDGDYSELEAHLNDFGPTLSARWNDMMSKRLGFSEYAAGDEALFESLGQIMIDHPTDYTIFHRLLADVKPQEVLNADSSAEQNIAPLAHAFYKEPDEKTAAVISGWLQAWATRVQQDSLDDQARVAQMKQLNPKYILRNWMAYQAIEATADRDYDQIAEIAELLQNPYDEQPEMEAKYFVRRPGWANETPDAYQLSCSS